MFKDELFALQKTLNLSKRDLHFIVVKNYNSEGTHVKENMQLKVWLTIEIRLKYFIVRQEQTEQKLYITSFSTERHSVL